MTSATGPEPNAAQSPGTPVTPRTERAPNTLHNVESSSPGASGVPTPLLSLRNVGKSFGHRALWKDLTIDINPGEFIAVLGPNGAGKSTLLKVLLGLESFSEGTIDLLGKPLRRASHHMGYIPQHHAFDENTPLRARDLVALGLNGHRFGFPRRSSAQRQRVAQLLEAVGAQDYADQPVGLLSGGEQQRLRAAQALAPEPAVLLCDEPLESLDLHHQQALTHVIASHAHSAGSAVMFVTHEINPVIEHVDKVLYIAGGNYTLGTVDEVMRSDVLSELYNAPIDVIEHQGRLVVLADHIEGGHHV